MPEIQASNYISNIDETAALIVDINHPATMGLIDRESMSSPFKNARLLILFLSLLCLLAGAIFLYLVSARYRFEANFREVLSSLQSTKVYEERARTEVVIGSRRLLIEGEYYLDKELETFQSFATTTIADAGQNISAADTFFTLKNVSVGEDVFYHIDTKSPALRYILTNGTGWHHYKKTNIPAALQDVAVSGPILDDLSILSDSGKYLVAVPQATHQSDLSEQSYRLRLSSDAFRSTIPAVLSIASHVGHDGTIEVVIDAERRLVRRIIFSGANYVSTTTILRTDERRTIVPPFPFSTSDTIRDAQKEASQPLR